MKINMMKTMINIIETMVGKNDCEILNISGFGNDKEYVGIANVTRVMLSTGNKEVFNVKITISYGSTPEDTNVDVIVTDSYGDIRSLNSALDIVDYDEMELLTQELHNAEKELYKQIANELVFGKTKSNVEDFTINLYGDSEHYVETRSDMLDRFLSLMISSEGSERERYTNIYMELKMGMNVCSDGM